MTTAATFVLWPALFLAGVWLGYPALVGLFALFTRDRAARGGRRPFVSVILATRETDEVVRQRVHDVMATRYPRELIEVVIGLDRPRSPEDGLSECAEGWEPVRVVAGDAPGGKALALNAAVRAAAGDILVFTDARQRFDPSAIDELIAAFSDPDVAAVSGCLDVSVNDGALPSPTECYWLLERWLREREARLHSTIGVTGAIYALRRSLWAPLPAGLILDDVFTPMRLVLSGHRIAFTRTARAWDDRRFAAAEEYRRKVRTLTGVLQLCAWLPQILVPWRNPVWLQFVAHKLLRLITPYLVAVMVAASAAMIWDAVRSGNIVEFAPFAVAPVLALLVWPAARMRVGRVLAWSIALHAAPVVAMINGLRGRWDVWR
jgi:cellulose synthase/poly-beta-1,6-N-acetylglucosamine synthase-like glycosyltransferase